MTFLEKISELNNDILNNLESDNSMEVYKLKTLINKYFALYEYSLSSPVAYFDRKDSFYSEKINKAYIYFKNGIKIRILCSDFYSSESGKYDFYVNLKGLELFFEEIDYIPTNSVIDLYSFLFKNPFEDLIFDNGEMKITIVNNYEFYSYEDNKYNFGYNTKTQYNYGKYVEIKFYRDQEDFVYIKTIYCGLDRYSEDEDLTLGTFINNTILKNKTNFANLIEKNIKFFCEKHNIPSSYNIYPQVLKKNRVKTKKISKRLSKVLLILSIVLFCFSLVYIGAKAIKEIEKNKFNNINTFFTSIEEHTKGVNKLINISDV